MTELTVDFNEPYVGGASGGTVGPIPPDQIGIDTRTYVLDTTSNEYRAEGVDVVQQRNATSNRDILLLPQNVWRSQNESWHFGAGQRNTDRDDSVQYRFSRSYGIDPWTKYQIKLLHETEMLYPLTVDERAFVQPHGTMLAVPHGAGITWIDPNGTITEQVVGTAAVIDVTYDGDDVITLHADGTVWKSSSPTVTAQYVFTLHGGASPLGATFIAYVKGYLILGVNNILYDITMPTGVLVYTSPITGFTWSDAAEGPNAIYLIGGSGDKYQIHRVSVRDDGTGLDPAITAATLPDGEIAVSIGAYLGYVFVGGYSGVRMATPGNSQGDLVLGSLLPAPGPVYSFEGQDRFVWATSPAVNPVPDTGIMPNFPQSTVCGLYRMDLTAFVLNSSTPAYASDIVAVDQTGKTVRSVCTWQNKRVFTVEGGGVYIETANLMPGGWMEPGRISFSVEDTKTGLYVQGKWEPLEGGTIAIDLAADSGDPIRVMNWSVKDTIASGNVPMNGLQFSRLDPRYVLYRDGVDKTVGPVMTRFEVRARPVKGAAARWYLPILNHESLDINGVINARNVNDEFDRLMGLVKTGKMFMLQIGRNVYQTVAVDFRWTPQKLTSQGDGWQGVYLLVAEEVK